MLVLVKERIDIIDDVRMPRSAHYKGLIYNKALPWLLVQVNLLNGNQEICPNLVGSEHTTRGPT